MDDVGLQYVRWTVEGADKRQIHVGFHDCINQSVPALWGLRSDIEACSRRNPVVAVVVQLITATRPSWDCEPAYGSLNLAKIDRDGTIQVDCNPREL